MMQTQEPLTVSQLVRADYRLADVFKKWRINYCCGGNLPLEEACRLQGVDQTGVEADMKQAQQTILLPNALSFDEWPVDFLVEYIVYVHHAYIKKVTPRLLESLISYVEGHKKKYPDLVHVQALFEKLAAAATEQLQHEEEVIFPYLKQISNALKRKETYGPLFVRTMRKSVVETTGKAQQQLLHLLTGLREATHNYQFPDSACTNYQVLYHKFKEYDADLVQHKHLENNILFPKVAQMEKELLQL
jgi:regulator of cell morphogenesis and NO signaling